MLIRIVPPKLITRREFVTMAAALTGVAALSREAFAAFTTWNPSDKSAGVTLSGGNLVAQSGTSASGVRGIDGASSGKGYVEYTYTVLNTNNLSTGFAISTQNLSGTPSTGITTVARATGNILVNGSAPGPSIGIIGASAVIGVAVDLTGKLIWYRKAPSGNWNGNGAADPATGANGVSISGISGSLYPLFIGGSSLQDTVTANFGSSGFSGTVPSGFTAGWPPVVAPTGGSRIIQ